MGNIATPTGGWFGEWAPETGGFRTRRRGRRAIWHSLKSRILRRSDETEAGDTHVTAARRELTEQVRAVEERTGRSRNPMNLTGSPILSSFIC